MSSTHAQDRQSINGEPLPTWASGRFEFRAGDARSHLVLDAGNVQTLSPGELANPDVTLIWDSEDARAILSYELQGNDALSVTTVMAGSYTGAPAPLNLAVRPELRELPSIPGATLGVQYLFRDGPFGDVKYVLTFDEGRVASEYLGVLEKPDVFVDVTYRAMALVRSGGITIIEALEGGNVAGEIGPLMLLAGVSESDEFHAAELATGLHAIPLAALGQVWRRPELIFRTRDLLAG